MRRSVRRGRLPCNQQCSCRCWRALDRRCYLLLPSRRRAFVSLVAPRSSPARPEEAPHLANPDLNPSFTKGIFMGEIREELVFPFPTLTGDECESLRMIVDSFRAFAGDHVDTRQLD